MEPTEAVATVHAPRAGEVMARVPQVVTEVDLLNDDIDRMRGLVDELEARLAGAGILQSQPEAGLLETKLDELVPMADRIRGMRHRVQSAADRVSSIFSRLEV